MQVVKMRWWLVLLSYLLVCSMTSHAQQLISMDSSNWQFSGDGVSLEQIDGRQAIKIKTGKAELNNLLLEDGVIEFDLYLSGERAFSYLYFRNESDDEHEEIYFRNHKGNAPDAVQYSPVFQRRSAWQIYHGDLGTASIPLPAQQWIKVKVELAGESMKLWVGDDAKPVLDIDQLGRKPQEGSLAFRGFVPRNSPAEYSAYFSNLKVTKKSSQKSEVNPPVDLPSGQITRWRVSPAFDAPTGPIAQLPELASDSKWEVPVMQSNGSFEFLRSRKIPDGSRHWAVVAQVNLKSDQEQTCALHLGFSDEITLSVNGQTILYQDASYRYSDRRQQGVMHPDQVVAFIPLKKGENLVRAVVADRFGGWGLSGRLESCRGVTQS
ncbi:hypothetical protein EYS14_11095 [Alteromonadaceae bacterium M269]|nr:hypothetical protein EYS14_11095 [Alteromonadaceae bacterium M269]